MLLLFSLTEASLQLLLVLQLPLLLGKLQLLLVLHAAPGVAGVAATPAAAVWPLPAAVLVSCSCQLLLLMLLLLLLLVLQLLSLLQLSGHCQLFLPAAAAADGVAAVVPAAAVWSLQL